MVADQRTLGTERHSLVKRGCATPWSRVTSSGSTRDDGAARRDHAERLSDAPEAAFFPGGFLAFAGTLVSAARSAGFAFFAAGATAAGAPDGLGSLLRDFAVLAAALAAGAFWEAGAGADAGGDFVLGAGAGASTLVDADFAAAGFAGDSFVFGAAAVSAAGVFVFPTVFASDVAFVLAIVLSAASKLSG
jgi:hypothetical protein